MDTSEHMRDSALQLLHIGPWTLREREQLLREREDLGIAWSEFAQALYNYQLNSYGSGMSILQASFGNWEIVQVLQGYAR